MPLGARWNTLVAMDELADRLDTMIYLLTQVVERLDAINASSAADPAMVYDDEPAPPMRLDLSAIGPFKLNGK